MPRDRKRGLVGKWMGKNLLSEILPFYSYAYIFFTLSLVRVRQQNYLGEVSKKYKHASNRNSPAEYPCIRIDAQNRILWLLHELPINKRVALLKSYIINLQLIISYNQVRQHYKTTPSQHLFSLLADD